MNKTETPNNIKYIGKIPVKLSGARGWIQPGQTLSLPEKVVNNLVWDKENWIRNELDEIPKPEPINPLMGDFTSSQEGDPPAGESPGEDKKKRSKKEAK
jgi:hypothetical protein